MQHVAPPAPLDDFAATLLTLNRTPAGLWSILLLSEIERLQRRGVAANLDMLVRGTGLSRTQVWGQIVEAESAGLLRARMIHQHRMVHKLTPAGHAALDEACTIVAALNGHSEGPVMFTGGGTEYQGGVALSAGGDQNDHPAPAIIAGGDQNDQGEVQNLHRGGQIDQGEGRPQNTTRVRARPQQAEALRVVTAAG